MEQTKSQELDKKIFSDYIYNPSAIGATETDALAGLIGNYPYSQLLRSFYTRSLLKSPSVIFDDELAKAALFSPDGEVLRTIIEDPELIKSHKNLIQNVEAETDGTTEPASEEEIIALQGADEIADEVVTITEEEIADSENEQTKDNQVDAEIEDTYPITPEASISDDSAPSLELPEEVQENPDYENEAGNAIGESPVSKEDTPLRETTTPNDELDLLVRQNAAAAYYIREEKSIESGVDSTENGVKPETDKAKDITHDAIVNDRQKISRYNDDKMPYSFLWWLDKTRKEHTDNYQPYTSFHLDTSQSIKRNSVDQLSTQIIENIFHLQSPVDELENAPKTVPFQIKRKEDVIVEKFIREEPQIKPPNSDKLDNENKARKSAEDPNDLVSETLAHIYTDQMLFHKAVETYKKLSLKFPEKSSYFADQIRELEKKIN